VVFAGSIRKYNGDLSNCRHQKKAEKPVFRVLGNRGYARDGIQRARLYTQAGRAEWSVLEDS